METSDLIVQSSHPELGHPPNPDHKSSHNPLSPSNRLNDFGPNQTSSALFAKTSPNEHEPLKGTYNALPTSISDTTTTYESGLQYPSHDILNTGTLHTLDSQTANESNKENINLEQLQGKDHIVDLLDKNKENGSISQGEQYKGTDIKDETTLGQKDLNKIKDQKDETNGDKKYSFKNLRVETNKPSESSEVQNIQQIRSDTDRSETLSLDLPINKEQTNAQTISPPKDLSKSIQSDQQFTSDQQDSEGYSSHRRVEDSPRESSGLSSTEESKRREAPRKETGHRPKITLADFQTVTLIGRGSYGEVSLVKKISNNKVYALKAIDKYFMKKVILITIFLFANYFFLLSVSYL